MTFYRSRLFLWHFPEAGIFLWHFPEAGIFLWHFPEAGLFYDILLKQAFFMTFCWNRPFLWHFAETGLFYDILLKLMFYGWLAVHGCVWADWQCIRCVLCLLPPYTTPYHVQQHPLRTHAEPTCRIPRTSYDNTIRPEQARNCCSLDTNRYKSNSIWGGTTGVLQAWSMELVGRKWLPGFGACPETAEHGWSGVQRESDSALFNISEACVAF